MKKRLMVIIIAIVGLMFTINVTNENKKLGSYIMLENVEALSQKEEAEGYICFEDFSNVGHELQTHFIYCGSCSPILSRYAINQSVCLE